MLQVEAGGVGAVNTLRRTRRIAYIALAVAASLGIAACGKTDASQPRASATTSSLPAVDIDLGEGQSVHFKAGEPLKIVLFTLGSGNAYNDALNKAAQEAAAKAGVTLDIQDPGGDPVKQVQQIQGVIQAKKYNAAIVQPVAPGLLCDLVTKQMPQADIVVVTTHEPLCGRVDKSIDEAWAPGSLAFVGDTSLVSSYQAWSAKIIADNPGRQKAILVTGPVGNGSSDNSVKALKQARQGHADFDVVAEVHTDFSAPDALKKVQDALQAHPDVTVVASIYSALTTSSLTALQQAGKTAKIYDIGADAAVIRLIQQGEVQMTTPYYAKSLAAAAVKALVDARDGKAPTRTFVNDGHPVEDLRSPGDERLFITKDNVDQFLKAGLAEY